MIVGIHQPNYVPGVSYFSKILRSNVFIFLDSVEYSKGGWTSRNRIKSPQGDLMLSVPVRTKGRLHQKISDVQIVSDAEWGKKHLRSLCQNYNRAPHFREFFPIFEEVYSQEWHFLAELNMHIIRRICAALGIEGKFLLSSEIDDENHSKTDRLICLTKTVGGDTYLCGQGGRKYIQREQFRNHNLDLLFMVFSPVHYTQQFGDFVPNLSIVDLLFNVGRKARAVIEESSEVES